MRAQTQTKFHATPYKDSPEELGEQQSRGNVLLPHGQASFDSSKPWVLAAA